MKKLIVSLLLGLAIVGMSGCAATPQKVLVTTVQTVDAAMQGWATWVALGHANVEKEQAVKAAYVKYQLAESVAENALIASMKSGDNSAWKLASQALTEQRTQLVALIEMFKQNTKGQP